VAEAIGGESTVIGRRRRRVDGAGSLRSVPRAVLDAGHTFRYSGIRVSSALLCAAACAGGGDAARDDVERIVSGDTVIVRNHAPLGIWGDTLTIVADLTIGALEGSPETMFADIVSIATRPDGSILVLDRQAREVREFDPEGRYVRTMGRQGSGPGEFQSPMAVRVDPSGRVLVMDGLARRVTVFSADGTLLTTWPVATLRPSYTLPIDARGNVYLMIQLPRDSTIPAGQPAPERLSYVRYAPDGTPGDTVPAEGWTLVPAGVRRTTFAGRYYTKENFVPLGMSLIHPSGAVLSGTADRYAFDLHRFTDNGHGDSAAPRLLRIERVVEPAALTEGESAEWRAYLEAMVERDVRQRSNITLPPGVTLPPVQPPHFPETGLKPYYRWVSVHSSGRIWVWRYTPAELRAHDTPPVAGALPLLSWEEPDVQDVFDADGTFLGTVALPPGYVISDSRGDTVWGTMTDELGVDYVFRARLVPRSEQANRFF